MSARFLRHVWRCRWSAAATTVLESRYGQGWYYKPTTYRLRERMAAIIRERWFGRVITASAITSSVTAALAASAGIAAFRALT